MCTYTLHNNMSNYSFSHYVYRTPAAHFIRTPQCTLIRYKFYKSPQERFLRIIHWFESIQCRNSPVGRLCQLYASYLSQYPNNKYLLGACYRFEIFLPNRMSKLARSTVIPYIWSKAQRVGVVIGDGWHSVVLFKLKFKYIYIYISESIYLHLPRW